MYNDPQANFQPHDVQELAMYPITYLLMTVNITIYLFMNYILYAQPRVFGLLMKYVIMDTGIVNIGVNHFVHIEFSHIFLNMLSLYRFRIFEARTGSKRYFMEIIQVWLVMTVIEYGRIFIMDYGGYEYTVSIGFSGILFALHSIYPKDLIIGDIIFDESYSAIVIMVITYLLVENSSLIAHLLGVAVGIFMKEYLEKRRIAFD